MFAHNCAGLVFSPFEWDLGKWWCAFASDRLQQWFIRALVGAVCACCLFFFFFLTKMSADMMCRENSRPPDTPNDVLPRSPASHSPHFLSIVNQHTHTHPYIPTCTYLTLNKKNNFHICEITYISWILKNIGVKMYM